MVDDTGRPRRAMSAAPAAADDDASTLIQTWTPTSGRRFAAAPADLPAPAPDFVEPDAVALSTPVVRRAAATAPSLDTPVPPPAVRPATDRAPGPGRRFSADALPAGWAEGAPRRSAVSPSQYGDVEPPSPTTTLLPTVGRATRAMGPPPPRPAHVRWFWPVVAVAVVAAIVLAWTLVTRAQQQPGAPQPTAETRPVLLIEPADAAGLGPGSWTATTDLTPDEGAGLRCILPSAVLATPPLGGTVVRRTLTAQSGTATVVQQQESYADAAAATTAFAARSAQLGGCLGSPDLVTAGYAVQGLADEAVGVQVEQQGKADQIHSLLVTRTGATLVITDAQAGTTPPTMASLVTAVAPALTRVCGATGGTCPATPVATESAIPASDPPGYLAAGDLPLVTTGVGSWVGAQIRPMKITGSGCEGISLTDVPKAKTKGQRSFVLTDDPAASDHFGLDEAVYAFASAAEAQKFSDRVIANVKSCPARQATATVKALGTLKSPDRGQLFTVDQLVTVDKAARFRVIVASSGKYAVFLGANPTAKFDLTDAEWLAVAKRALSRAKQLP